MVPRRIVKAYNYMWDHGYLGAVLGALIFLLAGLGGFAYYDYKTERNAARIDRIESQAELRKQLSRETTILVCEDNNQNNDVLRDLLNAFLEPVTPEQIAVMTPQERRNYNELVRAVSRLDPQDCHSLPTVTGERNGE